MPKLLKEVQCLVPISAFKTHAMAGVTLALKNMGLGLPSTRVIGGNKFGLPHNKLAEVNADVSWIAQKVVPKQMHIIEGKKGVTSSTVILDWQGAQRRVCRIRLRTTRGAQKVYRKGVMREPLIS